MAEKKKRDTAGESSGDPIEDAWAALDDQERAGARVVYLDSRTRPDRITVAFEAEPPTQPSPRKRGQGSGG